MDEWEVVPRVAVATAMQAQREGVAALAKTAEQLHREASSVIGQARETTHLLMREGIIAAPSDGPAA